MSCRLCRDLAWQLAEPGRPFFDTLAPEDMGAYLHDYKNDLLVRLSTVNLRSGGISAESCASEMHAGEPTQSITTVVGTHHVWRLPQRSDRFA